ncbi:sulfotransferase family protein [Actinomadura graeca]|uniref:sulfotransferase family protein n=1 Tax=Actinomadura graeca TaxID=2750812 RepID=UPI001E5A8164|nr:sulfotransferase family protein [Actinomadura graeca]
MKVIGAGFGRTGTASLRAALETLGLGPCYHMHVVIDEPFRVGHWFDIGEGRPPDWDEVFAGFRSTVDWPAAAYWRELAAHYPDAKVVLTVRDPERWYESADATIFARERARQGRRPLRHRVLQRLAERRSPGVALYPRMHKAIISDGVFGGRAGDRAHAIEVFRRHTEEVKAAIPPGRLLVYEVREGWEPLCAFLGVPVPDEPFPRVNDREEFRRGRSRRLLRLILGRRSGVHAAS